MKSENTDAESKKKSDFSQENNTFTEDGNREQEEHQKKDDYHRRDTYHQSEKKGKYHRREYQNRERTKQSDFERDFQTKDKTFTEGMEPEFHGSKKLDRLQNKAEKAGKKTEAARKKIPKTKEYSFERVFDEKTGKAKYVLTAVEKEKQFKPDSPVKVVAGRVGAEYSNFAHGKVAEVEKENSAVEGAHKTEQTAENVYHFVKRNHKSGLQRKKEKVAKLEKKQFKKEVNFRYQKFLEENPEMQEKTLKKQMQKRLQKQRIKREYAKARRAGQAAKNTKEEMSYHRIPMMMQQYRHLWRKRQDILVIRMYGAVLLRLRALTVPGLYAGYLPTAAYIICQEPRHRAYMTSVLRCQRQMPRLGTLYFLQVLTIRRDLSAMWVSIAETV